MKKICLLLLCLALLGLCACGAPAEENAGDDGKVEYVAAPETGDQNGAGTPAEPAPQPPAEPEDAPEPADTEPVEPADEPEAAEPDSADTAAQEPQPPAEEEPTPEPQPEPEPEPPAVEEPQPVEAAPADKKAAAEGLIGHPVSELYAAIGQPISSSYAPSCLDLEADDGELIYDGFVVYTLKTADAETVDSVF